MSVLDCTYSAFADSLRAFEIVGTRDAALNFFLYSFRRGILPVASTFISHCVREPKRLKKGAIEGGGAVRKVENVESCVNRDYAVAGGT